MSIFAAADRRFTFKRVTAFVLDAATAAATMAISRNPPTASLIEVRVTGGTANTGTVTVSGTTEDGGAGSEDLTFTAAGYKTTALRFTALSSFVTTGLADEATKPMVSARAVGPGGQPQNTTYSVVTDRAAALSDVRAKWPMGISGATEGIDDLAVLFVPYEDVWAPREGDIAVDDQTAEQFIVRGVVEKRGRLRVRQWELRVQRRQGSA